MFFGFLVICDIDFETMETEKLVFGKMIFRKWDFGKIVLGKRDFRKWNFGKIDFEKTDSRFRAVTALTLLLTKAAKVFSQASIFISS